MIGRAVAAAYVATVAGLATSGFAGDSTAGILSAVALALPSGIPGLVGYYVAYGLLAQVPGANPSESSGSASSSTGDAATWFLVTADVLGVAVLSSAAVANVLLWRLLWRPGNHGARSGQRGGDQAQASSERPDTSR